MGIVDTIKSVVGDTGNGEEMHDYQCEVCHVTFESTEENTSAIACPSCGANSVRAA